MGERKTIGIVGGGQLGRMLTLAAKSLGFDVIVINPEANSPASQVGAVEIVANLYDKSAIKKLAKISDYITYEIEHLDTAVFSGIDPLSTKINPAPKTIELIQDKYLQKVFLHKAGIPLAKFVEIKNAQSASRILEDFGGKMLLKTRHGAYDGRGNYFIKNKNDLGKSLELFSDKKLYAEEFIDFDKEIAVMVAKDIGGAMRTYPVVETVHDRNICVEVIVPAVLSESRKREAQEIAKNTISLFAGAGVFGVEMFLTRSGKILVNEIAPRVHNSGHYTTEACQTSQFEQHIRAISGLPLGSVDMVVPSAVMINILGERSGKTVIKGLDKALGIEGVSVHLYGKSPTKVDRKMGHITAVSGSVAQARKNAVKARKAISL